MDEDLERYRAMINSFSEAIIRAYSMRYPQPTGYEMNIIISSLSSALLSFLISLDKRDRGMFVVNLINSLLEVRDYE